MKVVALLGTPRPNGKSAAIAGRLIKTVKIMGAETEIIALNRLGFRGCQACMACKTKTDV